MKHLLIILTVLFIITAGCAVIAVRENEIPAGELYEGTAAGYRGPITVQVRLNGQNITEITVVDSIEDRFVGEAAMEELIDIVIENNSTDVDAVSGATITSSGFLEAVNNAKKLANM